MELVEEEDFTEETVNDEDDEEEDDFCRLEMVCSVCLLLSVVFLVGVDGIWLSEDEDEDLELLGFFRLTLATASSRSPSAARSTEDALSLVMSNCCNCFLLRGIFFCDEYVEVGN